MLKQLAAAAVLISTTAYADAARATSSCASGESTANEPIAQELAAEAGRARTWRYAWTGINAGSVALSLGGIPILPKSERPALVVGAATAAVSGLFTWFWPLDVEQDAEAAARLGCLAGVERATELTRLRDHSARDESARIQWPWHVGNFVTALIPGAILWFGFHRHLDALLATGGSVASGEIELLTQPTRLSGYATRSARTGLHPEVANGSLTLTYVVVW